MNPKSILVVVAIVLVSGCIINGQKEVDVGLNEAFKLEENQAAVLKDENIRIKLTEIIYSPCPEGVKCIWSGLGVKLMVFTGEGNDTPEVFLLEMGDEKSIFGLTIQNIEVKSSYVTLMVKKEAETDTNLDDIFGEDTDIIPPVIPD